MNPFEREEVISIFLQNNKVCETKYGKKIKNCHQLRESLEKEMGEPSACSSCKKKAIWSKYRQIVVANLIHD